MVAHGATVNTELQKMKPQGKGQIRMSMRQNPPTFLNDGMIFEDERGKTHAVWDVAAKSGRPSYAKAWLFFLIALILMTAISIHVPLSILVLPYGTMAWLLCRRAIPNPTRPQRAVRQTEPPLAGKVAPVYPRHVTGVRERIGDDERDIVLYELGAHFAAGRLKLDEHDERANEALSAVYADDLVNVLRELPHLEHYERRIR